MGVNKRLIGAGATDTGGGGGAVTADSHFKVLTYTGTGSSNQIGGLNFQPDLVWIKNIDSTANHVLVDSSRGRDGVLYANSSSAEAPSPAGTDLASFDTSGFTVGTGNNANANVSSNNYVAWCWHANGGNTSSNSVGDITSTVQVNQPAGFSITTYTNQGNASFRVGHGLGLTPKICLIKKFSVSAAWHFHTTAIDGSFDDIILNGTSAKTDLSLTAPTDTTFAAESGGSGENMICYSFADVEGYQKIGSYTGDSGTSHSITTGFKPAFLLIRRTDSGDNWVIFDSARDGTTNNNQVLFPNSDSAESNPNLGNGLDFTDNGFTLKTTDSSVNNSSGTYLYWAIAGTYPSETPTVEESFSAENWGGSDYRKNIMNNFRAGLVITRAKGESHHWGWYDIVRGVGKWLMPNSTGSENTGDYGPSAYNTNNTEFYGNHTPANSDYLNETYNGWFIKAAESTTSNSNGSITTTVSANAAAGFSIVKWTGTGSAGTLGHGLSAAPKFVIYKSATSTGEWVTWHTSYGGGDKYMYLNQNGAVGTQSSFYNGNPTSTVIYIGNHSDINASGQTCMAYCFTDISGFSSFGSYSGTGSLQTITTGFTPDFVVLKKTNASGEDWAVFSSYDLGMSLNSFNKTQAQQAFNNSTMFSQSTGFQVPSSSGMTNGSGQSYIYWAMKKNVTQDDTTQYNFNIVTYTGNGSANHYIDGFDFRPDLVITKVTNAVGQWSWFDTVRGAGNRADSTSSNAPSQVGDSLQSFKFDGFTYGNEAGNNNGEGYVSFAWRAGRTWLVNNDGGITSLANVNQSAGFSIVKYNGTQAAGATVGHGLSSAPEFIIVKRTDYGEDWVVYNSASGNTKTLNLNNSDAEVTDAAFNNTTPTSSVITLSNCASGSCINSNSGTYIAYCFHSVSGKRKFGSYTGNGSTQSITGLGFQPDFLMIKQTNGSNAWRVFNSVSGLSGKTLFFNLTSAIDTESNTVSSFDSDGWTMGSQQGVNDNGDTYIYWAEKIH